MSETAASIQRHVRVVSRPPSWRGQPYEIAYVLTDREPTVEELVSLSQSAAGEGLPHPRIVPPSILRWSSLFNPRFFTAVMADPAFPRRDEAAGLRWTDHRLDAIDLTKFWLQSTLFLAGVTLSAAIVQARYSPGTIGSKYDRLWEAGLLADAGVADELRSLQLLSTVKALAADASLDDVDRLLAIRRCFMAALARLAGDAGDVVGMPHEPLPSSVAGRFGFVDSLRAACGGGLRAVIAYGSSITSADFADYDLLLVADDPERLLRRFARQSPDWHGKELNLGVYSSDELLVMQRLSGDNLGQYGVCLWGDAAVVRKPTELLLARNFSFGVVRQRQQLGMLSRAVADPRPPAGDDRRNLYDYFVKIPANVAKGTFGAVGERLSKERILAWLRATMAFDVAHEQARAMRGDPARALAAATIATGRVLEELNRTLHLVEAQPLIRKEHAR